MRTLPKGYTLNFGCSNLGLTAGQTIFIGNRPSVQPTTASGAAKVYIRRAGVLRYAEISSYANATAGTAEAWSVYIRVNNTTDYLISTVSLAANERVWTNSGLAIPLNAGDYIELKSINPAWGTAPAGVPQLSGYVIIE